MSSIDFTVPVNPDAVAAKGAIPVSELDLIEYDIEKATAQKEEVLSKWTKNVE